MNFENTRPLTITIDGPSASGKGTLSKMISEHFSIPHLNSGLIYRQLAFDALRKNIDLKNNIKDLCEIASHVSLNNFNESTLSTEEVGVAASIVGNHKEIRQILFTLQQDFIKHSISNFSGCVLDGRDMGTVICPDASFKFFIKASAQQRAKRRVAQEENKSYDQILDNIIKRDQKDQQRLVSPLVPAKDAIEIDNSSIDAVTTFQIILKHIDDN